MIPPTDSIPIEFDVTSRIRILFKSSDYFPVKIAANIAAPVADASSGGTFKEKTVALLKYSLTIY